MGSLFGISEEEKSDGAGFGEYGGWGVGRLRTIKFRMLFSHWHARQEGPLEMTPLMERHALRVPPFTKIVPGKTCITLEKGGVRLQSRENTPSFTFLKGLD
jgi:hypothetical protein